MKLRILAIVSIILVVSFSNVMETAATGFEWQDMPNKPLPGVGHAEVYNGEIYFISEEWVQVYNPDNDTWWVKGPSLLYSHRGDSSLIGDRIYMIQSWRDAIYYNISTNLFHDVVDPNIDRLDVNSFVYNNTFYVYGGWTGGPVNRYEVEAYSPVNNTWWFVASQPYSLGYAVVVDDYVYTVSGYNKTFGSLLYYCRYDPINDTWELLGNTTKYVSNPVYFNGHFIGIASEGPDEIGFGFTPDLAHSFFGPKVPTDIYKEDLVVLNDSIYIVGSRLGDGTPLDVFLRWDGLESQSPEVNIHTPDDGILVGSSVNVTGNATDNGEVVRVQISLDGENWTICNGIENWYYEISLNHGWNSIIVQAVDAYNNSGRDRIDVYYDGMAPSIFVDTPLTLGPGINEISGRAIDDWDIEQIQWRYDNYGWRYLSGPGIENWSFEFNMTKNVTIIIRAQDWSDNVNISSFDFILDDKGPAVISSFPSPDSANISKNINLTLEFDEPVNTSSYTATITPGNTGLSITSWHENDTIFDWQMEGLPDNATIVFTFNCTDIYGNPMAEPYEMSFTTYSDIDDDGIIDEYDPDDDNDGVDDDLDAFPYDPSETADFDNDGIGDNADPDDDNDGVNDLEDAFPNDSTETADADNDGIGDNADPDDDNDGILDVDEDNPPQPPPEDYEKNYPFLILLLLVIAVCMYVMMFSRPENK